MSINKAMFYIGAIVLGLAVGSMAITLEQLEQKVNALETDFKARTSAIETKLESGGKRYQTILFSRVQLRDQDYLKLQFLGANYAWLDCLEDTCDLQACSSSDDNYRYFDGRCKGEEFQIIGEGSSFQPIRSGQRIRLRYKNGLSQNTWLGCDINAAYGTTGCHKSSCPGTPAQGKDFRGDRCWGEIFEIYARGRKDNEVIYNGDVVMLYYPRRQLYVTIQGENPGDDTNLNVCPGVAPPAYLSYGICSKNAFRIYRKP